MKRFFVAALAVMVLCLPQTIQAKVTHLLPKPQHVELKSGAAPFSLNRNVTVSYSGGAVKCELLEEFFTQNGCTITNGGAAVNVTLVSEIEGAYDYTLEGYENEAYILEISENAIEIKAITATGIIRAAQTLTQLAEGYPAGSEELEALSMTDWPAFKLRGYMHDVGRSYIPADELVKQIELFSRFKVNTFHWHLTENQAWRFEVKAYPQLTSTESMTRFEGSYYTQEECRLLMATAKKHGVIVIPEIDMPGHSEAFTRAMGFDMQSEEGKAVLKKVLDEVVEVFADAPYIHIGGDEVSTTADYLNGMIAYLGEKGKKATIWNPINGIGQNNLNAPLTQMWGTRGYLASGKANIDSRYNYTNHFDVFADLVGIYKSTIYYTEKGNAEVAGSISGCWNDRKMATVTDIMAQNNVYANVIATAERTWIGGGKQYIDNCTNGGTNGGGGVMLPNSGEEYDEFADWERRFLFHKANSLKNEPIPYVKQTNIRWRITDAFPNNGNTSTVFPPEAAGTTESNTLIDESFTHDGNTYYTGMATGAGIYLSHTWGNSIIKAYYNSPAYNHTAYAWTFVYSDKEQEAGAQIEFQNYSRSEQDPAPGRGNWDLYGSKIWLNGKEIAAPEYENTGVSISSKEVTLKNENFAARKPIKVTLKKGWNKVFLKLPYINAGYRLDKWMFTFVLTDTEGKNAVDGLIYSPNQCMDETTELVAAKISEIKRDRGAYIGKAVGLWPESTAATLDAKVKEIEATYSATMTAEERAAQIAALEEAWRAFTAQLTGDNMNKPVSGHIYRMYTPLRGNRHPTSKGAGEAIVGEQNPTKASAWKFVARTDGTYNIVNLADGTYISPASNNNTALNTVSEEPAAGWSIKKASGNGYVVITSGSAQFNQQKDGNLYLLNWGSGTNTTDDGCQYRLIDVTDEMSIPLAGHFYRMYTPLRDNRYPTSKGAGEAIVGEQNPTTKASVWEFVKRTDGTYNIVNLADGTYISPASSNNTALNTVSKEPAAGWSLKEASTSGYFIITSGSVQFNQTNSGQNYKLYNWGGGTNTTDTGCQYKLIDVTAEMPPRSIAAIGLPAGATYPYLIDKNIAKSIFGQKSLTIAMDVDITTLPGNGAFICASDISKTSDDANYDNNSTFVAVGANDKKIRFFATAKSGGYYTSGSELLTAGRNHKIVIVIDSEKETRKVYVNGTETDNSSLFQDFYHFNGNENADIYLGGGVTSTGNKYVLNGSTINSVQFFDQALTPEKIALLDYPTTMSLPFKAEIEGWTENNPNTHLGTISFTSGTAKRNSKLTPDNQAMRFIEVEKSGTVTCALTREYRGFEFLGFSIGNEELGKNPTLTAEQLGSLTGETPLVAKFKTTKDVTLFYDDDLKSYRIPAIGKTSTGRLIAVSDYRYSLDDIGRDNHGTGSHRIDLVIRTSDDNGATWSAKQTIAQGTDVKGSNECAYGDAAIATVGEKVLVMAAAGDVVFSSGSASAHNRAVRLFSEDNGVTWTKKDISETLFIGENATIPNGYTAFFGSGKLAVDENFNETGNARIYGAMLIKNAAAGNNVYAIYTDDLGCTWKILGGSQTPVAYADEPKVEIMPNGQILLSVRRGGGRKFNVFTYGTGENDKANGAGTWNGAVDGCGNGGSNSTNGEIYCIDAKKQDGTAVKLLLQSQPKGGSGLYDRKDVTIWYKEVSADAVYTSNDIAGNWIPGQQVSYVLSSYSTMTMQNDGKIAFFFEEAPCYGDDYTKGYSMVYVPLTVEGITNCNYFSKETDLNAETTIDVVLSDAEGNTYCDRLTNCTLNNVSTRLAEKYPFITLGNTPEFTAGNSGDSYTYTNSVTLPFKVSNSNTTVWHNIYWPSNTGSAYPIYMSANSAEDNYVPKVTESVEYGNSSYNTQEHADKISWAIYNVDNGFKFAFRNKLTGKYITVTGVADGNAQNVVYTDKANATAFEIIPDAASYNGDYAIKSVTDGTTGYVCSTSAGYQYATYYSGNGHQGAWVKFVEAPDFAAMIEDVNNTLSLLGGKLGQYTATDKDAADAAKTAMENSSTVKLNTLNTYKNLLDGATLNMPKAGTYFRVAYDYGGETGKLYMQSTASSVKGVQFTSGTGKESIWFYYNGALYSYNAGQCLRETGNDRGLQAVGGKTNVTFSASTRAKGKYNITCGSYIHANSSGSNFFTDHCSSNNCAAHDLILEEVTELPLTITAAQFATFYAPVAVELPEAVNAHTVSINGEWAVLSEGFKTVPANTGVILSGEAGEYNASITSTDTTVESGLEGTVAKSVIKKEDGKQYYILGYIDNVAGLYTPVYSNTDDTKFTNGSHKAYLAVKGANGAASYSFRFDDGTTGIEGVTSASGKVEAIYDLQGRKVTAPDKGMYIIDGKKVLVK